MTHNMQKNIAMVCLILMICPYIFCGIVIYILQLNNKAECQKHQQFIHSLTNIQLMNNEARYHMTFEVKT